MASTVSVTDVQRIEASQYVSVAGLVILLWDHILTFGDEVQLIWKIQTSVPKLLFLFNRYIVPFVMIVQLHEFGGMSPYLSLTVSTCKIWYAVAVAVGMLSIATSNFLILLRLWVLWDRPPRLMLSTLTVFVVTQIVALSLAGYVIYEMLPTLVFEPVMRVCIPMVKPDFVLLWAPGIVFELMIFLTTVWNALDRPRSRNGQMAKIMYRDGSMYFFGLCALRVTNMVLSIVAPVSLTFLGVFFIWSVSNVTLSRLILNLRRLCNATLVEGKDDEKLSDDANDGVELSVLQGKQSPSQYSDPDLQSKMML